MARFHRHLWFGFATTVISLILSINWVEKKYYEPPIRLLNLTLDDKFTDRSASYPGKAKRMHLFWVSDYSGAGIGVKLFQHPKLFDSIFPGYGGAIADQDLWKRYFRQPFHSCFVNSILSRPGKDIVAWNSWTGNLDLCARYGVDVIIFGNSQTWSLPPGILRDKLDMTGGPALKNKKVLSFATGGARPANILLEMQAVRASGQKAGVAILGYSFDFLRPSVQNEDRDDFTAFFKSWRYRNNWLGAKFESFVRLMNWNKIIWLNSERIERTKEENTFSIKRIDGFEVRKNSLEQQWLFSYGLAKNKDALNKIAAHTPISLHAGFQYDTDHCDLVKESVELDHMIDVIGKVADKILIFIPPTPPLHTGSWPKCLLDGTRKMLLSRRSERVFVEVGDWSTYGLDYEDFVRPIDGGGFLHFDISHVNYTGASKVVSRISKLIAHEIRR